jgi:RNA polymerase sigma-70 factor (ECF subfamily)
MPATPDIGRLFSRYRDKVYWLALGVSRNEKDAEDITQNAFLKILKNLRRFRGDSRLSTWIYRIAYNEALMHLRKRRREIPLDGPAERRLSESLPAFHVNWSALPDEELLRGEFRTRVEDAIRRMPIKYRMALLLHHVESLSVKDAAAVLGLKAGSVKTRLHRAYLMLRSEIADYMGDKEQPSGAEDRRCGAWTGSLFEYAVGKMRRETEEGFMRHISDCPGCNSFLDSYRKAIRITNALQCRDLPAELRVKIESFITKSVSAH